MPPKKYALNQEHGYIGDKPASKAKPKPIIVPPELTAYYLERDRIIYKTTKDQSTKDAILRRYGKA